ncbi:MAG: SDR family oxidoreductase [Gammaproteobacteria bacterium]|nr:SDR family oxidoreductase [Gammaproteobacteria bacterium]NVK87185.1 SDR family oxidoreductase [Gammaproteobacteria bacterium]
MENFSGKVVVITGGTRGIGAATAQRFAQLGATVIALYRNNQQQAAAQKVTLQQLGPQAKHQVVQCDITESEALAEQFQAIVTQHGRLDILVNNAGIGPYHPLPSTDFKTWQQVWSDTLQTNLIAVANSCFLAAEIMREQGQGHIINVSSRGAFRGEPDKPAYGASKAAVNALTQSLAASLGTSNIAVAGVAPGFVDTELTAAKLEGPEGDAIRSQSPFNRVATASDVANAIVYLASDAATFCSGTIIDVNGASYFR